MESSDDWNMSGSGPGTIPWYPQSYGEYRRYKRGGFGNQFDQPPPPIKRGYCDQFDQPPPPIKRFRDESQDRDGNKQFSSHQGMMTLKSFLSTQDDNITEEEAVSRYSNYKLKFKRQKTNELFSAHKSEEWFREKYHPLERGTRGELLSRRMKSRLELFWKLVDKLENVRIDGDQEKYLVEEMDLVASSLEDISIKLETPEVNKVFVDGELAEVSNLLDKKIEEVNLLVEKNKTECHDIPDKEIDGDEEFLVDNVDPQQIEVDGSTGHEDRSYEIEELDQARIEFHDMTESYILGDEEPVAENVDPQQIIAESYGSNSRDDDQSYNSGSEDQPSDSEELYESETLAETIPSSPCLRNDVDIANNSLNLTDEDNEHITSLSEKTGGHIDLVLPQLDGLTDNLLSDSKSEVQAALSAAALSLPAVTLTVGIHLRSVPPTMSRNQVKELVNKYPGYLRIALSDPVPGREWIRKVWITFSKDTNIKEICLNLDKTGLGPVVNRDLSRRVKLVTRITNDIRVVRNDIRLASRIVTNLDEKWGLNIDGGIYNNKLLDNLTDYVVEEADTEEEELLGLGNTHDEDLTDMVWDKTLIKVLDRLIWYLRVVHSLDFYNATQYPHEDEMPHKIGIFHARGKFSSEMVSRVDIEDYIQQFQSKLTKFLELSQELGADEVAQLGGKLEKEELDKFFEENIKELGKDKWLCPLSGKKFKSPEFVKKHIESKFGNELDQVKYHVQFLNNFLADPKRPTHPETARTDERGANYGSRRGYQVQDNRQYQHGYRGGDDQHMGARGGWKRPWNRGGIKSRLGYSGKVSQEIQDPRNIVDYSDIDMEG